MPRKAVYLHVVHIILNGLSFNLYEKICKIEQNQIGRRHLHFWRGNAGSVWNELKNSKITHSICKSDTSYVDVKGWLKCILSYDQHLTSKPWNFRNYAIATINSIPNLSCVCMYKYSHKQCDIICCIIWLPFCRWCRQDHRVEPPGKQVLGHQMAALLLQAWWPTMNNQIQQEPRLVKVSVTQRIHFNLKERN